MDLAAQVDDLRAGGSEVQTLFPVGGAGDVFNANALDPSTRLQAARGGYEQGRAIDLPVANTVFCWRRPQSTCTDTVHCGWRAYTVKRFVA